MPSRTSTSALAVALLAAPFGFAQTCDETKDVIIGSGFVKELQNVASSGDCCSACYDFGYGCQAYTYEPSTKICFLKDNTKMGNKTSDRVSGKPGAGPRPAGNKTVSTRACLPPHDTYPFCNTSLSIEERVDDLISRLNDDEIPPLLTAREGGGGSPGPPGNISRLGLPEYDWGLNCIHGVQSTCGFNTKGDPACPTSFPNPNALGATWNSTLWREIGAIIGIEARALWLQGATEASSWSGRPHIGLDCWSPNININRDPRWGRNQEVPSEDPYANGVFGTQYTLGLQQGQDDRYLQAIVTLKHWDAYSLEDSDGFTRHNFDAKLSNFTLADTYLPAFRASVVEGNAQGVMCSYNSVNGVPTCASPFLNSVLRDQWNFTGYVTSDTGAVNDIYAQHKYRPDGEGAACAALRDGGCDINSGGVYMAHLLNGVKKGDCSMDDVKTALRRTLGLRFRLGLFDPIEGQPYWHVSPDVVNTTESQETNKRASRESIVLLQNNGPDGKSMQGKGLPFAKGKSVAVIGPHGKADSAMVGNYLGQLCPDAQGSFSCIETPLDAITAANAGGSTSYTQGSDVTKEVSGGVDEAVAAAKNADQVVMILGIDESIESESRDRTSIDLPQVQHDLAAAVLAVGKPTVIVLLNGGMVGLEAEKKAAPAIVEAFYPGFWGGQAIATTIFGDNENLGGKMPFTTYGVDYTDQVKMSDMRMEPHDNSPGRSYRYYTGTPTFPAFQGLALTDFTFDWEQASGAEQPVQMETGATSSAPYTAKVKVTNTGSRTGDTVAFLFQTPKSLDVQPRNSLIRKLIGFERVLLAAGASTTVQFDVSVRELSMVATGQGTTAAREGDVVSTPGEFMLEVTDGNENGNRLVQSVQVQGTEVVLEPFPRY